MCVHLQHRWAFGRIDAKTLTDGLAIVMEDRASAIIAPIANLDVRVLILRVSSDGRIVVCDSRGIGRWDG